MNENPHQTGGQWLAERCGKLTASRMKHAMDFKKGKNGEVPSQKQLDCAMNLVEERMTGQCVEMFVNDAMKWGLEKEPEARAAYERLTGYKVELVGFLDHAFIEYCGASPDGFVGQDGLVEIKCPSSSTHLEYLRDKVVPEEHKPQMLLQISVTGRKWCDLFSYDPRNRFKPEFLVKYTPTVEEIANVEAHAIRFLKYVDELFEKITGG